MPIYEYRCSECAHQLEKLQRMNDDRLVDCPACGEPALKRLVSAVAFRLKGSGWYETDFKQGNKRNLAESTDQESSSKSASGKDAKQADKSKATDTDKSSAASTEKKPAAKVASKSDKAGKTQNA